MAMRRNVTGSIPGFMTSMEGHQGLTSNCSLDDVALASGSVRCILGINHLSQQFMPTNLPQDSTYDRGSNPSNIHSEANRTRRLRSVHPLTEATSLEHPSSISINTSTSASGFATEQIKRVILDGESVTKTLTKHQSHAALSPTVNSTDQGGNSLKTLSRTSSAPTMKDKRYDSFKTLSGRLERQISNLRGKPQGDQEADCSEIIEIEPVPPVHRYFDALEGPELDTLRASEVSVLPEDKKWPFLLRFPISSFGMCLGVGSQAILWKALALSSSLSFLHIRLEINLILWCISVALMAIVSVIYSLKVIFYFTAVRREFYHPIRVNFFFAPWIACLFLVLGLPQEIALKPSPIIWYVLMTPIFCLELKIYGQWMSGGKRRLSKVANPSNHLAIVGNFVGALLGASMGLKEGPIFFFAVGLAHYLVLFVTLYQRLPTNQALPQELHPVFFLFVAAPSVASTAWDKIHDDFDYVSRIGYFVSLFLYLSLAVRINFFRGFRFSLAWWAYTFPMTGAAIATITYSMKVTNVFTQALSIGLSAISSFTVFGLLVATVIHAFVLNDLFPNDIAIAITEKRPKSSKITSHVRAESPDIKDIEAQVLRDASPKD